MDVNKTRSLLNMLFLVGVLISMILYFTVDDKKVFLYVCGATLFVKVVEFIIRFTHR